MKIDKLELKLDGADLNEHQINYTNEKGVHCTDELHCSEEMAILIHGLLGGHTAPCESAVKIKPFTQDSIMRFCPMTGDENCYPTHSKQWRDYHGEAAWIFNPWTGKMRVAHDIASDVFGVAITQ